ncbi:MAG: T9SS type A sorting domain-containing protein [Ignavibacteria bacterium]|nr:T9SS type A sorting domain-containing protein [Ignavibacteria bacterium]MBT8381906.1 T9SS type A sorting domain-containing protein [Ignavibacteria bacterium]MBT8390589.1 T9SS type A sorting domain-containing protein [Ignavibacteria bacterium]NNL22376.1 T9SS type A sorting domain-containing protein [Ignavibacteriaceae bacterium]
MLGELDTTYFTAEVIGDTILNNGKNYSVISPRDLIRGIFIRADSSSVYYYDENEQEEDTLFKLDANVGDIWYTDFDWIFIVELEKKDTIIFLGHLTETLRFKLDGLALGWITLSNIFGPITSTDWGDPPGNTQTFTFTYHCIINEKIFGEPLLAPINIAILHKFDLEQNYPNPFNPTTKIKYQIPESSFVKLKVYDVIGNEIATLVNEKKLAGTYEIEFYGTGLPSGIYFYQLKAGNFIETNKMLMLK